MSGAAAEMPPELATRIARLSGADMWHLAGPDLRPSIQMADGPMGVASGRVDERDVAILGPAPVAIGASWDRALAARLAAMIGAEARQRGVRLMLAPNLNLARSPLAGRAFEMFSEDPFLAGSLGAAWVEGLHSQGVGACLKHFAGNDTETRRHHYDAVIDPVTLHEVVLRPFEIALGAGPEAVMAAYNRLNGVPCVANHFLLTEILREAWNFDGVVMSDWFGTSDGVASFSAGLDLEMPGPARAFGANLARAVMGGGIAPTAIGRSVARIERMVDTILARPVGPAPDVAETLTEAAAAGFTLLRNEGALLPIAPERGLRIAAIGPNWEFPCHQGGSFAKIALDPATPTPLAALRAGSGPASVVRHAAGVAPTRRLPPMKVACPEAPALPGMMVSYHPDPDCAEPAAFSERRDANSLIFFIDLPGGLTLDQKRGLRARGIFTPDCDGPHRFRVGGTGRLRLWLDGVAVYARDAAAASPDIMGALLAAETEAVVLECRAGEPVTVELVAALDPARAHGVWYGIEPPLDRAAMLAEAVAEAAAADLVLLMLGDAGDTGVEAKDRPTDQLPADQRALYEAVFAANPRLCCLVNTGHAADLGFAETAPCLMLLWYPGQGFAPALAETLTGRREPGGRLAVSIAQDLADHPVGDPRPDAADQVRYHEAGRIGYRALAQPRFAFGAGFGYTDFSMTDLRIIADGDEVDAEILVENISARAGKAVVQIYGIGPGEDAPRLAGFDAAFLAAGAACRVRVRLDQRAFQRFCPERGWVRRAGLHRIGLGRDCRTWLAETSLAVSE